MGSRRGGHDFRARIVHFRASPTGRGRWRHAPSGARLTSVTAPALDRAADDPCLIAGLAPQAGEAGVGRRRALLGLEVVEADADRDGDAFAADDALAVAKRRDGVEEAARAFGHRGPDAGLVAIVVEAHRNDRAALRQHAFGEIRRALRDQAERHAVFAAF